MFALRIAQTCRRRAVWASTSIPRARTYSVKNTPFDRVGIQRKLNEIPTWNRMRDNSEVMEAVKSAGEVFMKLGLSDPSVGQMAKMKALLNPEVRAVMVRVNEAFQKAGINPTDPQVAKDLSAALALLTPEAK